MKLVRVLFTVTTLSAISVSSVPIPSCRWEHDIGCCRTSESISSVGDGLLIKRGHQMILTPHEGSLKLIRPEDHADQRILEVRGNTRRDAIVNPEFKPQEKVHKQRRSSIPPAHDQSPQGRGESPNPTMEEMRLYLSDEEMESYIEHWRAGKEFRIRLYYIERGHALTKEEEEKFNADRKSYNEARKLEKAITVMLVRSNRARPKMVQRYEEILRDRVTRRTSMIGRKKELETLIENDMASPDEVKEYEGLLVKIQRIEQSKKKSKERKRKVEEERMKELERRVNEGVATDAERVEYEKMIAKREEERVRRNEWQKVRIEKKKIAENERIEELEGRIKKGIASDTERGEYEDMIAKRQKEKNRKYQADKERAVKKETAEKKRIEELERRINSKVATDAERAEYQETVAAREEKRARKAEAERVRAAKRRAAAKKRREQLEKRIKNGKATDAEREEYSEMMSKRQKQQERQAQYNKSYQDKQKETRIGEDIPSSEMESAEGGQSNAGQPLQSSNNPLQHKMDSVLNRLGQLWQASSRARSRPWNISPGPPPTYVPFGVIP